MNLFMNLLTITILAAVLYIVYRIAVKFTNKKNSTEIFLDELNAKHKEAEVSTPKKEILTKEAKKKIITHITETGEYTAPVAKPKRKYKKKPKA